MLLVQQRRDDQRVAVILAHCFFIHGFLNVVVEVVLDEVPVEDLEAVKEVEQVKEVPVQLEFAYRCCLLYHRLLGVLLDGLVDLGAGLVELGRENAHAFGKLDHLADIEVDALIFLVRLEFIGQRFVDLYSPFVIT